MPFVYVDVYTSLVDETGRMNPKFTNDGLHLLGEGYLSWKKVIEKYLK
jgi:lysophospholipase L1-like esterase